MTKTLLLALAAIAAACALHSGDAAHAHIKIHIQQLHAPADSPPPQHERKHVFRVHTRKSLFDRAARHVAGQRGVALDVWSVRVVEGSGRSDTSDPLVDAKVYATPASMKAFARGGAAPHAKVHGPSKSVTIESSNQSNSDWMLDIVEEDKATAELIKADRAEVAACLNRTTGFLAQLQQHAAGGSKYTDSAFFECFRPQDQVFAFLDALAAQNSAVLTKLPTISHTFEGRAIPAYRLSTSTPSAAAASRPKKSIYVQSLIHAREWQAGSSTFYTIAKLVDELRRGAAHATALLDEFDWYFVPIVNIDGYIYSGTVDRYWRTNRRIVDAKGMPIAGVDLNRNFGPDELFNLKPELVDEETYPGEKALSEPSTAGVFRFVSGLENLAGVVDVHTFGGDVLRPFSNRAGEAPAPFGPLLKKLADGVSAALTKHAAQPYSSKTGAGLYEAYGCFDDSVFLAFNFTVPTLTLEVEGDDFIVPQSSIRPVGRSIYHGLLRFAEEAASYRKALGRAAQ
ncbi:hypothetical protein PybrP1_003622 [[Pythium] brassicae (nom. inval.)]|nr:hypothetical protein PybrP1_003622 [[Pythium] brassicae (nom. inval.)]